VYKSGTLSRSSRAAVSQLGSRKNRTSSSQDLVFKLVSSESLVLSEHELGIRIGESKRDQTRKIAGVLVKRRAECWSTKLNERTGKGGGVGTRHHLAGRRGNQEKGHQAAARVGALADVPRGVLKWKWGITL